MISARSSFCDAFKVAAAFSSLNHALSEVKTSLTSLSKIFNLLLKFLIVLVSTTSSVLNLFCTSFKLCFSISIASVFEPVVLVRFFSALSITAFCLLIYVSWLVILLLIRSILCVRLWFWRFCTNYFQVCSKFFKNL